MCLLYESVMNGRASVVRPSIRFIISGSMAGCRTAIHFLLIKCKVKNFMDINRQISAEKYVYFGVETCGLFFWNVHNEVLL